MPRRIVYLSWNANEISGGIKIAFRHVEALSEIGRTTAVATENGNPPTWFETTAEVIKIRQISATDILVFPENHSEFLSQFAGSGHRKLVLFQGVPWVARGLNGRRCYSEFGVSHLICVGEYAAKYCAARFPQIPASIIPVAVRLDIFSPSIDHPLAIVLSQRKRQIEAAFIFDFFRINEPDIPFIEIKAASERRVASLLRRSAIFLSLCRLETCPLVPLEAMASGCICTGFTGVGGRDYATVENGIWVEEDDLMGAVDALHLAVAIVRENGKAHSKMLHAGFETAKKYDFRKMVEALATFYDRWL